MTLKRITNLAAVAGLMLAVPAAAAPDGTAEPVASEQVSAGMLTVTPNQPSVSSVVRISGPEGYEATVWNEAGGAVSANLMAEGRFAVGDGGGEPGTQSIREGRFLPDGRYRYEAIFYQPDGEQRTQSGVLFVAGGAATSRGAKQTELRERRADLEAEGTGRSASGGIGAEGLYADDFVSINDASEFGHPGVSMRIDSLYPDPGQIWHVENFAGDLQVSAGLPQLNNVIRPFTIRSDQRVGIGTTNPQADLHIFRPTGVIRITDSDPCPNPNAAWQMQEFNGSMLFSVVPNCAGDADGSKMLIGGNGRVGIGTVSPSAQLHVEDTGSITSLRLQAGSEFRDLRAFADGGFQIDDTVGGRAMRIFPGTPDNALVLRNGSVGLLTDNPQATLHVAGSGRIDGDVALGSSRTLKTGFGSVSPTEMLARVADLPVASWRYKTEDEDKRHIGPFAEDFQRLFGLGDGQTISVIDAQGVTLAAIQGLQQKLAEKDAAIAQLRSENAELEARLTSVEVRLNDSR